MAIHRETLMRELIHSLKQAENERLLEAMAREINNHIFIRGTFSQGQELTSQDMQLILSRLTIVQTTLALSELGQSHEAYAPKRPEPAKREQHLNPVPPLDQSALDGLEKDLRSSRGGGRP